MSLGTDEIVRVVDDAGSAVVAGEVSVELARVLARAARVNHLVEERPDLSFSSTLIALVGGADDTSHWLRTYLSSTDVDIPELLRTRSIADEAELETILEPAVEPIELAEPLVASRSAVRLLRAARRLSEEASNGAALDVRHLIGAYIYDGADHEADFDHLQFNRPDWSVAFVTFVGRWRPTEATTWSDQHRRKFPKTPLGVVDNVGPSTHITSDLWTTTDSLGYSAYAFAIAKFIRH